MAELSIVTTCMGRLDALRQTVRPMLDQTVPAPVLVVDYSCPDGAGDWVETAEPRARVIRAPGHDRFNLSAARNLGAAAVETPWIAFVDADVVLDPRFAETVLRMLAPGGYYRAATDDGGLGGSFLCARADLERVGGHDEVFACWGEEDNDLFDAFAHIGIERRTYPGALLRHLAHDDATRTRFYPIADRTIGHAINRVYRILKWDTVRLRQELLSLEMRRALHAKVSDVVAASMASGQPAELRIRHPEGIVPGDRSLARTMVYHLDARR